MKKTMKIRLLLQTELNRSCRAAADRCRRRKKLGSAARRPAVALSYHFQPCGFVMFIKHCQHIVSTKICNNAAPDQSGFRFPKFTGNSHFPVDFPFQVPSMRIVRCAQPLWKICKLGDLAKSAIAAAN